MKATCQIFSTILLFILIFACIIACEPPSRSCSSTSTYVGPPYLEDASNYSYGYGTFGEPPAHLKKDNGAVLLPGVDFAYDYTLVNIYDTNNINEFSNGKYFRVVNDGLNVASGLNLTPIAMDFSSDIFSPPSNEIYIDPVSGQFVLPRPIYWNKFESSSDISNPFIFSPKYISTIKYGDLVDNIVPMKFGNGLALSNSAAVNGGEYTITFDNINKGVFSFWVLMDYLHGVSAITIHLSDNTSIQLAYYIGTGWIHNIVINGSPVASDTTALNTAFHHAYIIWDKDAGCMGSKSVRIFIDGAEIMSSATSFTVTKTTMVFGDLLTAYQCVVRLDNLKIWDDIIGDSANYSSWLYNDGNGREDALHEIYGATNAYKPKDVKVGYYK